jgi:two-component system sensor histidine kinase/response regulator
MLLALATNIWWTLFLLSLTGVCVFVLTRRWSVRRLADAFNRLAEEQRRRETAFRAATHAAEAANRLKSELLGRISQEIRTPANRVVAMIDLALEEPLPPVEKQCIDAARTSAKSLLAVIDEILDYTRIETGPVELTPSPFALGEILAIAIEPLAVRAQGKGVELTIDVAPDVADCLIGDAGILRQVLGNVVGNAVKFTNEGSVAVLVETHARDVDAICLRFSVRDTGIGIPPEKRRLIFEAFRQADTATSREYGGTGLGLAISTRLVTALRGHLWVESEPGRGSDFHFTAWFRRASSHLAPVALQGSTSYAVGAAQ